MWKTLFGWKDSSSKNNNRNIIENPEALEKKALHQPFDFDNWYHALAPYTFDSRILPISVGTAKAMISYYQARFNNRQILTKKDVELLSELEQKIANELSIFNNQSVFVRMSNRSPKDGMPLSETGETVNERYQQFIKEQMPKDDNDRMVLLSEFQQTLLKCTKAKQVMNLLLTSERVFCDLLLAIDCHHASLDDKWQTSIILREWNNDLRGDLEFRVFVHKGVVTGISQYNHYCRFKSLTDDLNDQKREALRKNIIEYVSNVHSTVPQDSYVIDVALIKDKLFVVEINPFQESTGAALYDWRRDEEILFNKKPNQAPEFRFHQKPIENLKDLADVCEQEFEKTDTQGYDEFFISSLPITNHP